MKCRIHINLIYLRAFFILVGCFVFYTCIVDVPNKNQKADECSEKPQVAETLALMYKLFPFLRKTGTAHLNITFSQAMVFAVISTCVARL